jgi:hypothetical protein
MTFLKSRNISVAMVLVAMLGLLGCSSGLALPSASGGETGPEYCLGLYPSGAFQVTHTIEGTFPGGRRIAMIGVSRVHGHGRGFRSVLLTPEGMVLFDATRTSQETLVYRALPPFDSQEFASALLTDVELMLFPPGGAFLESGATRDGRRVCRWGIRGGGKVEVTVNSDGWEEVMSDAGGAQVRRLTAAGEREPGFYETITVTAPGSAGYTLELHLLEVDR